MAVSQKPTLAPDSSQIWEPGVYYTAYQKINRLEHPFLVSVGLKLLQETLLVSASWQLFWSHSVCSLASLGVFLVALFLFLTLTGKGIMNRISFRDFPKLF